MIIAIDFDGTIVEHKYPGIGNLLPYAREAINCLYERGHEIIIWTCRYTENDLIDMQNFLLTSNIKYHKINKNSESLTNFSPHPKIYADIYIDDRNLFHINDWHLILNRVLSWEVL